MKEYFIVESEVPNPIEEQIWQKNFYERVYPRLFQDAFFQNYAKNEWNSKISKEIIKETEPDELATIAQHALVILEKDIDSKLSPLYVGKTQNFMHGLDSVVIEIILKEPESINLIQIGGKFENAEGLVKYLYDIMHKAMIKLEENNNLMIRQQQITIFKKLAVI